MSSTGDDTLEPTPDSEESKSADLATDGGRRTQQASTGGIGDLPLQQGTIAGVAAFAVGYLFTYVKESGQATDALGQLAGLGGSPETWQAIGWMYAVMHNAKIEITGSAGGQTMSQTMGSGSLQEQWMLLVPVVALVGAGYWVASQQSVNADVSGLKAGATVVVGYVVCMAAPAVLSKWSFSMTSFGQSVSVSVGPKLVETIAIGGVGYPVVLGAIGGALGDS